MGCVHYRLIPHSRKNHAYRSGFRNICHNDDSSEFLDRLFRSDVLAGFLPVLRWRQRVSRGSNLCGGWYPVGPLRLRRWVVRHGRWAFGRGRCRLQQLTNGALELNAQAHASRLLLDVEADRRHSGIIAPSTPVRVRAWPEDVGRRSNQTRAAKTEHSVTPVVSSVRSLIGGDELRARRGRHLGTPSIRVSGVGTANLSSKLVRRIDFVTSGV